jgi:uncharacterized protein YeaO (DUF488 family)
MDNRVILSRAQIGRGRQGLDVTVKSAADFARHFAPTWKMVMDYKAGKLSRAEYAREYARILENLVVPRDISELGNRAGEHRRLVFLCYCRDGEFCHTLLLIAWLCRRFPDLFTTESAGEA